MGLAISLSGVAKSLLDNFGDDAVLNKVTLGTFDPITGVTQDSIVSHNVKVSYVDYQSENGGIGDGKMTITADIEINLHDTITHNGVTRRIIDIVNIQAQNTIIIYDVRVTSDNRKLSK